MSSGYIKLYRDIAFNELWQVRPYDKARAWVDLLLKANHADGTCLIGNRLITVKRGQLVTSIIKLSDRWGWSRKKTLDFIRFLKGTSMVTTESTTKYTTLTIVNYAKYQGEGTTKNTPNDTQNETPKKLQKNTNNNNKNINNNINTKNTMVKKVVLVDAGFKEFWESYPRKVGKQKCLDWWNKHKPDIELRKKMLETISWQRQSEQWQKDNGQYIPHPYTWLNQGRWEDERTVKEAPPQFDDKLLSDYYG